MAPTKRKGATATKKDESEPSKVENGIAEEKVEKTEELPKSQETGDSGAPKKKVAKKAAAAKPKKAAKATKEKVEGTRRGRSAAKV